ncbi:MAG: HK97 family phage prohead protease [Parvularculaceae bacterium]
MSRKGFGIRDSGLGNRGTALGKGERFKAPIPNPDSPNYIARLEGYASIFDIPDMNGDVVAPGAFRAALTKRPDVKMLYQHAVEAPIGRWTRIAEDETGLFVEGELLLSSERAREVYALLAGRAIDGLSIGFKTVRAAKEGAYRVILEADLWEVSVVTFPMAAHARVTRLSPPEEQSSIADAPDFADALRGAAEIFAVETKAFSPLPFTGEGPGVRGGLPSFNNPSPLTPLPQAGEGNPSSNQTIRNLSK